jgi:hypothetical protein
MAPFAIDTGMDTPGPQFGFGRDVLMDGILDSLPPNPPQHDIDRALFAALRRDFHTPVKAATVRKHACMFWHLIAPIADRDGPLFDAIIAELHEALSDRA